MSFKVMKADPETGYDIEVFANADKEAALKVAIGLLHPLPLKFPFWVADESGRSIADPKVIADFADANGFPNPMR